MLSLLSPRQREAYELKAQGMTRNEVAEVMGIEPSRVKNLWQEGRRKIRRKHTEITPHAQLEKPRSIRPAQLSSCIV